MVSAVFLLFLCKHLFAASSVIGRFLSGLHLAHGIAYNTIKIAAELINTVIQKNFKYKYL